MTITNEVLHRVLVRVAALTILSVPIAFLLQFTIKRVHGMGVKYWRVYGMVLLAGILAYGIALTAVGVLPVSIFRRNPLAQVLAIGAFTFMIFGFQSILLKLELNLALRRACAIAFVFFFMCFALLAIVGFFLDAVGLLGVAGESCDLRVQGTSQMKRACHLQ